MIGSIYTRPTRSNAPCLCRIGSRGLTVMVSHSLFGGMNSKKRLCDMSLATGKYTWILWKAGRIEERTCAQLLVDGRLPDNVPEILIAKDVVEFQARSKSNWSSWHGLDFRNAKISRYFWNESVHWYRDFYMTL